jgi:hypothetical protein
VTALLDRVRGVLGQAVEAYRGTPAEAGLRRQLLRLDGPLRVAVAGQVKAGKSTLLNALVGEEIAATDAGECTRVVTWYRHGRAPRVTAYPGAGEPRQLPVRHEHGRLRIDLRGQDPSGVDRLVVDWPSASLRDTVLIDTPGIASLSGEVSARTTRFLTPDDGPGDADAVVYLLRHLHAADVRLLESLHDNAFGRGNPLNTIGVLSRADEIGSGRIDALHSARRIAERYRADERLRGLCGTVLPVAGLLAQGGRTLRQDEFRLLYLLSTVDREVLDPALLSADRFTAAPLDVDPAARAALLDRLGLFGVRLSIVLLRQGFRDPAGLAEELVRRSGIDELRGVLAVRFAERRDLLKARSALLALDAVLRTDPQPASTALAGTVEGLLAGAHEFVELRVLGRLRAGATGLSPADAEDAERLLGAHGSRVPARLGLDPDAAPAAQRAAALAALHHWQTVAEHPLTPRPTRDTARAVIRTCESITTTLA